MYNNSIIITVGFYRTGIHNPRSRARDPAPKELYPALEQVEKYKNRLLIYELISKLCNLLQ